MAKEEGKTVQMDIKLIEQEAEERYPLTLNPTRNFDLSISNEIQRAKREGWIAGREKADQEYQELFEISENIRRERNELRNLCEDQNLKIRDWDKEIAELKADMQIMEEQDRLRCETYEKLICQMESQQATIDELRDGLKLIEQMSDPGSPERAITYMKGIASKFLSKT